MSAPASTCCTPRASTIPTVRRDPDDRPRQHGNRDGGHRGRRVRVPRQAVRDGADDRDHQARRKIARTRAEDENEAAAIDDLPETEMIGSSPRMIEIYKTVSHVAPTDATVLIEGETGTGKELIARMIHRNSKRAQQPFVPVDCGAIAPSLLESELFGALQGAYTGADRDRMGVFEAAHNGTVFLDEIGDIELGFQFKLLRFLQEREIRPLGASRAKKVDVRVIAATNRDLQKMVEEGKFREDLWYRLNVVRLTVPPLCERPSDIPLLVALFPEALQRALQPGHAS